MRIDKEIQLKNVTKSFGDLIVLHDLTLSMAKKKATCLMGRSGCGKTTLLQILLGLLDMDHGEIIGLEKSQPIAAVFQENRLCKQISAVMNVSMVMPKRPEPLSKIFLLFTAMNLDEKFFFCPVSQLSGGMQRRVAIARALAFDADLILMDEPLKGLDEETKENVIQCIRKETEGKTLIFTTHDIEEQQKFDADLIVLENQPQLKF